MFHLFKKFVQKSTDNKIFNDEGFSLLELVVAVGIMMILSVGGLIGYNGIQKQAHQAYHQRIGNEMYLFAVNNRTNGDYTVPESFDEWAESNGLAIALRGETQCTHEMLLVDTDANYVIDGNNVQLDPNDIINNKKNYVIYMIYIEKENGSVTVQTMDYQKQIQILKIEPNFNESYFKCSERYNT